MSQINVPKQLNTATTETQTPAQIAVQKWEVKSAGARFGAYLLAWVVTYFLFDLLMAVVCSDAGDSWWAYFALAGILTIPGQLIVGPLVCGALAVPRLRLRPMMLVVPFLLVGFPVCFEVSRLLFSAYWSLSA